MTLRIAGASANSMCDDFTALIDAGGAGQIEIRSGSQPADADDVATGSEVATLTFSATAFGAASSGTCTANPITDDTSATGGTAGWFRVTANGGAGATIFDGAVGTSGQELNLNTTTIPAAGTVSITSMSVSMPES